MAKFGFEDEDEVVPKVDLSGLRPAKRPKAEKPTMAAVSAGSEKLGFSDRTPQKQQSQLKRRPGRKPPKEPKIPVLISGPESVINAFKQYCIENGELPYWEGLKRLLDNQGEI